MKDRAVLSYRVAMRPLREGITGNSVDQQILAETVPVLPPIDQRALRFGTGDYPVWVGAAGHVQAAEDCQ